MEKKGEEKHKRKHKRKGKHKRKEKEEGMEKMEKEMEKREIKASGVEDQHSMKKELHTMQSQHKMQDLLEATSCS